MKKKKYNTLAHHRRECWHWPGEKIKLKNEARNKSPLTLDPSLTISAAFRLSPQYLLLISRQALPPMGEHPTPGFFIIMIKMIFLQRSHCFSKSDLIRGLRCSPGCSCCWHMPCRPETRTRDRWFFFSFMKSQVPLTWNNLYFFCSR